MDIKEKISKLLRIYQSLLEKEEKIIEETIGKPDKYTVWQEAVNAQSCYKVFVKDLENLLEEGGENEDSSRN